MGSRAEPVSSMRTICLRPYILGQRRSISQPGPSSPSDSLSAVDGDVWTGAAFPVKYRSPFVSNNYAFTVNVCLDVPNVSARASK